MLESVFLCCLIAYLHPASHNPERVSNYNKYNYNKKIKLHNVIPLHNLILFKKIRESNKKKV